LELRAHPQRGRGVFTRSPIAKGTLIHLSPILLFDHKEYAEHGKYTKLDHYTYCWKGGYALALGLGSMFNHEPFGHENVGFTRDMDNALIRYTALRDIEPGEELCICYGPNVWFDV
ncbi:SET domain-containing protein, partial [Martensiomyces pterosporus]